MEDCNTLVSDCIVVSCCCQCLILQLLVFIFVHLPRRLARRTKEYAKKKLARRKRKAKGEKKNGDHRVHKPEFVGFEDGRSMSMRVLEVEGIGVSKLHRWGGCTDEVEKVLGELSRKGEFAFGSFWGGNHQENVGLCSKCCRTMSKDDVLEYGSHVVKFHFIEVVRPS